MLTITPTAPLARSKTTPACRMRRRWSLSRLPLISAAAVLVLALGAASASAATTALAWGINPDGQLGDGTTTNSSAPVAVSAGAIPAEVSIAQIAAGGDSALALGSDGHVYGWGYDGDGELGNGTTANRVSAP